MFNIFIWRLITGVTDVSYREIDCDCVLGLVQNLLLELYVSIMSLGCSVLKLWYEQVE